MTWKEFCSLLSGIMPDTPLGQVVSIRSEQDKNIIKNFTPSQKKIRQEWQKRIAQEKRSENIEQELKLIEKQLARLFG